MLEISHWNLKRRNQSCNGCSLEIIFDHLARNADYQRIILQIYNFTILMNRFLAFNANKFFLFLAYLFIAEARNAVFGNLIKERLMIIIDCLEIFYGLAEIFSTYDSFHFRFQFLNFRDF